MENSITQVSDVMKERKRKQELINLKMERSKNLNPLMNVLNSKLNDSNKSKTVFIFIMIYFTLAFACAFDFTEWWSYSDITKWRC